MRCGYCGTVWPDDADECPMCSNSTCADSDLFCSCEFCNNLHMIGVKCGWCRGSKVLSVGVKELWPYHNYPAKHIERKEYITRLRRNFLLEYIGGPQLNALIHASLKSCDECCYTQDTKSGCVLRETLHELRELCQQDVCPGCGYSDDEDSYED